MRFVKSLIIILAIFSISCGNKDEVHPLASPKQLTFDPIKLEPTGNIDPIEINKNKFSNFVGGLVGWIPIVKDVVQLPLNLSIGIANALIPPIKVRDDIPIGKDGSWNDPAILQYVKSVKLVSGFLHVAKREQPGKFNFFQPSHPNDINFLKELRVSIFWKDKQGQEVQDSEIPIAYANTEKHFNRDTQQLVFETNPVNIKPYYDKYYKKYGMFEVRTLASGKIPKEDITLDGQFTVSVTLILPPPY